MTPTISSVPDSGAQQVVGVAVAVHDLRAQGRQARQDLALEARIEVRAERLGVVGHPGLDAGLQQQRPLDVPGHEVARVRVEEPLQSARELRLEGGGVAKRVDPERLALRKRRPRKPAQQPHHVALAVRGRDPLAVIASRRRDDARHRQVRGVTLEVAQRRDLEIDGALALAGGGDLQDVARAVRGRDPVVLVALAVERRELAFQAPVLAGAVPELPERKRGRIEVQVHGAEGALEGDIHS